MMKGVAIEREPMTIGQVSRTGTGALAKYDVPQSEPEDIEGRLNFLSPNAFKGKGAHWELRQALENLAKVEQLMRELMGITRTVPGREIVLAILKFEKGERWVMRWRIAHGVSRTVRFDVAQEQYWARYAEPLRGWYDTVSQQAQMLNLRHRKIKAKIKELRAQLPTMPVFPRVQQGIQLHELAQERLVAFVASTK